MPEYEFKNEKGKPRTVFMSMAEAPEIGSTIEHEGEKLTRVASNTSVHMDFVPFSSHMLAPGHPHAEEYDETGAPSFSSKRQLDEFIDKNNADPECDNIVWDR